MNTGRCPDGQPCTPRSLDGGGVGRGGLPGLQNADWLSPLLGQRPGLPVSLWVTTDPPRTRSSSTLQKDSRIFIRKDFAHSAELIF